MRLAQLALISLAMVMHTTAQAPAPAPAPDDGAPAPAPMDAPAPAPAPMDAPAPAPAPDAPAPAPSAPSPSSPAPSAPGPAAPAPAPAPVTAAPAPAPVTTTMDVNASNVTTTTAVLPTPVVEMTMNMDVADPAGFVADEHSQPAMEMAVAAMAGVDEADVSCELSVGTESRRLLAVKRRLQDTFVIVDATISVADESAATAMQSTLDAVTPEMMTNHTLDALEAAGVDTSALGLNVTGAVTSIRLPPAPPPAGGSGTASGAILSCKASSLAPFFAVSAWLLSHV